MGGGPGRAPPLPLARPNGGARSCFSARPRRAARSPDSRGRALRGGSWPVRPLLVVEGDGERPVPKPVQQFATCCSDRECGFGNGGRTRMQERWFCFFVCFPVQGCLLNTVINTALEKYFSSSPRGSVAERRLRPRALSWGPGIESRVGLPARSLLLPLPVSLPFSLCVCLSLVNKIKNL